MALVELVGVGGGEEGRRGRQRWWTMCSGLNIALSACGSLVMIAPFEDFAHQNTINVQAIDEQR